MIDSKIVYAKRMMDKSNKNASRKLLEEYYSECQKVCNHENFIDIGYYKIHNSEYDAVNKEKAELRIVECEECHTTLMLLRTDNVMWDVLYGDRQINIDKNINDEKNVNHCKKIVLK